MFIAKLNEIEGEGTYRLPTEAEWEYAAREAVAGSPPAVKGRAPTRRRWPADDRDPDIGLR